ncbi:uncharacterized protein BT62DRAFT_922558 [Guyanagaster necrorhizus]|uniref:Uncharacterized protein n=1 Tax=Guyanagaster necrorhizus TaxID=856835 RepID=A0A9P8AQ91_9AGAR|nr:uncharacterized protein BT62DRAFT_922558 [Guyanagaster necrorhizus MCA 3950]KAG7442627.1 hypothetical protein BT62DRAFT_922558 [Guyanagaster necrorhizus MCA 3950]
MDVLLHSFLKYDAAYAVLQSLASSLSLTQSYTQYRDFRNRAHALLARNAAQGMIPERAGGSSEDVPADEQEGGGDEEDIGRPERDRDRGTVEEGNSPYCLLSGRLESGPRRTNDGFTDVISPSSGLQEVASGLGERISRHLEGALPTNVVETTSFDVPSSGAASCPNWTSLNNQGLYIYEAIITFNDCFFATLHTLYDPLLSCIL